MQDLKFGLSPYVCMQAIPNPSPYSFFLYRGSKYVGSQVCTQSLRMYIGYTESFSVHFFRTMTEDFFSWKSVARGWSQRYTLFLGKTPPFPPPKKSTAFFPRKSVARGWSVTPFFGAKRPLSPPKKQTCLSSKAHTISACLYKTLTLMLYNLINHPNLMGAVNNSLPTDNIYCCIFIIKEQHKNKKMTLYNSM